MKIWRPLAFQPRIGDQARGHGLFGRQGIRLDRPLAAVLKGRLADRSAARPLAFGPVVVWAAGVFTLFAVSYFAVQVASSVAGLARYERLEERERMEFLFGRSRPPTDISVDRALNVIMRVPRHRFVSETQQDRAYRPTALPIGWGRMIPDAYTVLLMAELAVPVLTHEVELGAGEETTVFTTFTVPVPDRKVLEVGTGSGYSAAVLSEMAGHVYTIEPVEPLAVRAAATLGDLGYGNVTIRIDDGNEGWPELAPFDSIVIKAPVDSVPRTLIDQLAVGGKLVAPVGPENGMQVLQVLEKRADGSVERTRVGEVRFPPLIGSE